MIGRLLKAAVKLAAREGIATAAQEAGAAVGQALGTVLARKIDPDFRREGHDDPAAKPSKPEGGP